MPRFLRVVLIGAVSLVVLAGGGYYFVLHTLKSQVTRLLGEQGEYSSLEVSFKAIVIENLSLHTDRTADSSEGWPVDDELRAARVVIEPDLRSLLSDNILIRKLRFEKAYLPVMRVSGGVRFLPSLLENRRKARAAKGEPEGLPPKKYVHIAHVDIVDSDVDFFDATLGAKPYRLPLHKVEGNVEKLKLPTLDEAVTLDLKAVTGENGRAGSVALSGKLVPRTRDSELKLKLRGVDLRQLQPYFVKRARTQIQTGTLDMDITSTVRDRALHAPGTLVLHKLKLDGGLGIGDLNRRITLALIKDERDRIALDFTLAGNLGDTKFSLNEELYVRTVSALARSLGLSIEGLGKGVLGIGEGIGGLLHDIVK